MTGLGAMPPCAVAPTKVALFKRKQALSLGHANAYSCPVSFIRFLSR